MFTKDLSVNATLYGQEQCVWCGAASAQMARNGYRNQQIVCSITRSTCGIRFRSTPFQRT